MKRNSFLLLLALVLLNISLKAQVTENFTNETHNSRNFSEGGVNFTLNNFLYVKVGASNGTGYSNKGWTGSASDDYYVDDMESGSIPYNTGSLGSIKASKTFFANSIYVYCANNMPSISNAGTVVFYGKRNGTTLFTQTLESSQINTNSSSMNGYTLVDFSANSSYSINEIEIVITGSLRYLRFDAFKFTPNTDVTAPTVTITSTASNPTTSPTIPLTITFSEPVTGFDASDITVTNGTKGTLSGSGSTYTMEITPASLGLVTVNIAAGVTQDAALNNNTAATQFSITVNKPVPNITLDVDPALLNQSVQFSLRANTDTHIKVDLGNGTLVDYLISSGTDTYVSGVCTGTIKLYGDNLWLYYNGPNLAAADFSNCPSIKQVIIDGGTIETINFEKNSLMQLIYIKNTQLKSIVLNNPSLITLDVSNNQLTSLDISNLSRLASLTCSNNKLTSLTLPNNNYLNYIKCDNNYLNQLTVYKISSFISFTLTNNGNYLNFATLTPRGASTYTYSPQRDYRIPYTQTSPVIDLSSQYNISSNITSYVWKTKSGTVLTKDVDYSISNGVTRFINIPGDSIYCEMTNSAFPALTLKTNNTKIVLQDNALSFDGSNDYIDLGTLNPTNNFSAGFSYMGLVKFDSFNNWSRLLDLGNGQTSDNIVIANGGTTGNIQFHVYQGSSPLSLATEDILTSGTWVHVATTLSSTGFAKIYINGELIVSKQLQKPINISRSKCYIGKSNWASDAYFAGILDEVSIWTKELSQTEIINYMRTPIANPRSIPELYAYYNFYQGLANGDNTASSILTDQSASLKTATLNSFALNGTTSNFVPSFNPANIEELIKVSENSVSLTPTNSNSVNVSVTSNTIWTVSKSDSWIVVTPENTNTGDVTLSISAGALASGASRTGTVTLSGKNGNVVISVIQSNQVTGTSEKEQPKLTVTPNPATDYIQLSETSDIRNISIINSSGVLVWKGVASSFPLNISHFTKGIYFVNIEMGEKIQRFKIVKQ